MFCIPGGRKPGQFQVHDLARCSRSSELQAHEFLQGRLLWFLLMSGVRRSGIKSLFAHRNQKVLLSYCSKYCKLHALAAAKSPSLGKRNNNNKPQQPFWGRGTQKTKNQTVTRSKLTLGAPSQVYHSDRPTYQQLPVDTLACKIHDPC